MKITISALLLFSLIVCSAMVDIASSTDAPPAAPVTAMDANECASKCENRCSNNWKNKMCLKMCNTCCQKCNCVPSGPKADKAECPCYRDMKNKKGQSKCP